MIFQELHQLPNPKETKREPPASNLYRSNLMVRGDNPKHLNKLDELKADVATINLEDGIANKDYALQLTKVFLSHLKRSYAKIAVRVNDIDSGGLEEIRALKPYKPDAFRIPKLKNLRQLEEALFVSDTSVDIYLTIETKEAFENIAVFASHPRVKVLYLGILDLYADLGLPQSMLAFDNPTTRYILSRFVLKCRTSGAIPVSFTYQEYTNSIDYEEWCRISKASGMAGQGCIAPNQVEIANSVFGHSEDEIEKARYIKEVFEGAHLLGESGFSDERYGFIDEPIYRDALLILGISR